MAIVMTLWIGNGSVLKSSSQLRLKKKKNENYIILAMNYLFSKLF